MAYERYAAQVQLLVRILPFVADDAAFALKGGTAINLFYRDMPRLSVDIDLVYLPIEDRPTIRQNMPNSGLHLKSCFDRKASVNAISVRRQII